MDTIDFRSRIKLFAIAIIRFLRSLSNDFIDKIIAKQLLISGSSIAANYRAACRSRSKPEFFSKLSIVVEETDETMFWLEVLIESGISDNEKTRELFVRAEEFIKIFSKARKTVSIQLKS